jgi:hypothetical protein
LLTALRYARMAAPMMSVDRPWPEYRRPPLRSFNQGVAQRFASLGDGADLEILQLVVVA